MSTQLRKTAVPWFTSEKGINEIYTNNILLTWSLYDVRVRLGHMVPHPKAGESSQFVPACEETAAVTMPWQNAKTLRDQLGKLIEEYEKVNGEIRLNLQLPDPS